MTRRNAILVLVFTAILACLSVAVIREPTLVIPESARQHILATGSCKLPIAPGVELTSGDRCAIDLIAQRCGEMDQCFVNCFTSGRGVDVGGGCAHLCNYGRRKNWSAPDGTKECYASSRKSLLP